MIPFILFTVGNILVTSGLDLICTNDFVKMTSCHFDAPNCSEHNMTLNSTKANLTCAFGQCVSGCCCDISMMLILGETFTAHVYKRGQHVHSQSIGISETIKPQTPSIISVEESNGNYQIQWKTNSDKVLRDSLEATVTYNIKGSNEKISVLQKPKTMDDTNSLFILGSTLKPNTTYVVSVRTKRIYGVFSDISSEVEFKTGSSQNGGHIILISCLSVLAIVLSGVAYVLSINVKGKLWDKAAIEEKPKLLDIKPKKKAILMPESLNVYSLNVEPLVSKDDLTLSTESLADSCGRSGQTSGISTGSSHFSYANTEPVDIEACVMEAVHKALPIFPPSPAVDTSRREEPKDRSVNPPDVTQAMPSSLIVFTNETYNITNISNLNNMTQMSCDSGYHSSEGPPLQDFIISPAVLSVIETNMSYQPCTKSEDNSLTSSSRTSSGLSADSHNLLPVVYGYQDFEKLMEQSNSVSLEHRGEACQPLMVELMSNTNSAGAGLSQGELSVPLKLPNEIIVDYGYHCV